MAKDKSDKKRKAKPHQTVVQRRKAVMRRLHKRDVKNGVQNGPHYRYIGGQCFAVDLPTTRDIFCAVKAPDIPKEFSPVIGLEAVDGTRDIGRVVSEYGKRQAQIAQVEAAKRAQAIREQQNDAHAAAVARRKAKALRKEQRQAAYRAANPTPRTFKERVDDALAGKPSQPSISVEQGLANVMADVLAGGPARPSA